MANEKSSARRVLSVVILVLTIGLAADGRGVEFLATTSVGQSDEKGPDGTPLACNFNLRLAGGTDPTGNSSTCDTYHFNLFRHPFKAEQSTFQISGKGLSDPFTYHLADMPLNEPVLLLEPNKAPTRIIARRRADRIDFVVGRVPFKAPPPKALLPH